MSFRLQIRNYRGLRAIDWSPEGVCALVGANGSGKTTLLDVPALLGDALDRGLARALEDAGGVANARNLYAAYDEPYDFTLTVGDATWHLAPLVTEKGFRSEETLTIGGRTVISREAGADHARFDGVAEPVMDALALSVGVRRGSTDEPAHLLSQRGLQEVLSRY